MKNLWEIIDKADDASQSIADSSNILAKAWKNILISTGLIVIVFVAFASTFTAWQGRKELAKLTYEFLVMGLEDVPRFSYEWDRVPVEVWPEGWICNPMSRSCRPNLDKREKVINVLNRVMFETNAIRAVYSVYGENYRRIAAQVKIANERELPEDLWIIKTSEAGYSQNRLNHFRGQCNNIIISELPESSRLRIEAALYNTAQITNCPTNADDIPYQAKGYISIDFDMETLDEEQLNTIQDFIKIAAEDVEDIMGYDRKPSN